MTAWLTRSGTAPSSIRGSPLTWLGSPSPAIGISPPSSPCAAAIGRQTQGPPTPSSPRSWRPGSRAGRWPFGSPSSGSSARSSRSRCDERVRLGATAPPCSTSCARRRGCSSPATRSPGGHDFHRRQHQPGQRVPDLRAAEPPPSGETAGRSARRAPARGRPTGVRQRHPADELDELVRGLQGSPELAESGSQAADALASGASLAAIAHAAAART